eukprot:124570-Hanusia_phi.AAC.3
MDVLYLARSLLEHLRRLGNDVGEPGRLLAVDDYELVLLRVLQDVVHEGNVVHEAGGGGVGLAVLDLVALLQEVLEVVHVLLGVEPEAELAVAPEAVVDEDPIHVFHGPRRHAHVAVVAVEVRVLHDVGVDAYDGLGVHPLQVAVVSPQVEYVLVLARDVLRWLHPGVRLDKDRQGPRAVVDEDGKVRPVPHLRHGDGPVDIELELQPGEERGELLAGEDVEHVPGGVVLQPHVRLAGHVQAAHAHAAERGHAPGGGRDVDDGVPPAHGAEEAAGEGVLTHPAEHALL